MKEITLFAVIENLDAITDFVDAELELNDCSMKTITQINIVIDELFSNVAQYAYPNSPGNVTVTIDVNSSKITLQIIDSGIKFNPLENKDPDVTASIEERAVGGLGIFMVKKTMDEILYEYQDGKNILTIIKNL